MRREGRSDESVGAVMRGSRATRRRAMQQEKRLTYHSSHRVSLVAWVRVRDINSHQHGALVQDPGEGHGRILRGWDGVDEVGVAIVY